jgi:RNA 3'-terminal phosphate cyclase (ATP)
MNRTRHVIEIDGAEGEGGGQILRSALALSLCTQIPFRIERIRAGRKKPGLLRQHLTAVELARRISGARVEGALVGSTALCFVPERPRAGQYTAEIGTAGSCSLVLQAVLPALLTGGGEGSGETPGEASGGAGGKGTSGRGAETTIEISGGTHNPGSPPADFLQLAFLPLLRRMGVEIELDLIRMGFYPAGGGRIAVRIRPAARLLPIAVDARGPLVEVKATAYVAGLPVHIAQRELEEIQKALGLPDSALHLRMLPKEVGPGNVLLLEYAFAEVREVFTGFGERGVSAEAVAARLIAEARDYLAGEAALGARLADQILLPMALAGAGTFTTSRVSAHLLSHAEVIRRFLPGLRIEVAEIGPACHRVTVAG